MWSYKRELFVANVALEFCCWDTETLCISPFGLVGNIRGIKASGILNPKGKIGSEATEQTAMEANTNS